MQFNQDVMPAVWQARVGSSREARQLSRYVDNLSIEISYSFLSIDCCFFFKYYTPKCSSFNDKLVQPK